MCRPPSLPVSLFGFTGFGGFFFSSSAEIDFKVHGGAVAWAMEQFF
jgi:hypothetical protein